MTPGKTQVIEQLIYFVLDFLNKEKFFCSFTCDVYTRTYSASTVERIAVKLKFSVSWSFS